MFKWERLHRLTTLAAYALAFGLPAFATASAQAPAASAQDQATPPRTGVGRYKTHLRGLWVQKEYVEAIRRDRSPVAASELLTGVTDLSYDSVSDSLILGLNHHAWLTGHAEVLIDESRALPTGKGQGLGIWRATLEGYDFRLEPIDSDTLLLCKGFEGSWTMVRVSPNPEITLRYFVQTELFGGNFVLQDSLEHTISRKLAMWADGLMEGFEPYNNYQVWTDYTDDLPRMNTIVLSTRQHERTWYAWDWQPETIALYKLTGDPSHPNAESQQGALVYTLVRLTDPAGVLPK